MSPAYWPHAVEAIRLIEDVLAAIEHAHVPRVAGKVGVGSRRPVEAGLHVGERVQPIDRRIIIVIIYKTFQLFNIRQPPIT